MFQCFIEHIVSNPTEV